MSLCLMILCSMHLSLIQIFYIFFIVQTPPEYDIIVSKKCKLLAWLVCKKAETCIFSFAVIFVTYQSFRVFSRRIVQLCSTTSATQSGPGYSARDRKERIDSFLLVHTIDKMILLVLTKGSYWQYWLTLSSDGSYSNISISRVSRIYL